MLGSRNHSASSSAALVQIKQQEVHWSCNKKTWLFSWTSAMHSSIPVALKRIVFDTCGFVSFICVTFIYPQMIQIA